MYSGYVSSCASKKTKKHKLVCGGIEPKVFTKLYPLQHKLFTKKQSNIHTKNKPPQPTK